MKRFIRTLTVSDVIIASCALAIGAFALFSCSDELSKPPTNELVTVQDSKTKRIVAQIDPKTGKIYEVLGNKEEAVQLLIAEIFTLNNKLAEKAAPATKKP